MRKYGNAHCFNSLFPTWVTESPVFFLIPHSIIITAKLYISVAFYASKTSPVSQWSESKMRMKKVGEFPLQKNLSENVYKFPFDKNSSRLVDNIIIIFITTFLTWLLSRSLILSSSYYSYHHCQHYYYSHLVIILLTCPFNCAVASRLKGNENMKKMKKKSPWKKRECTSVMTVNSKNLGKL